MKEYGNFFPKKDVYIPSGNYIAEGVECAKTRIITFEKHKIVKYYVETLVHEARERGEMRMNVEKLGDGIYVFYTYFDYNGRVYYWWEIFKHNNYSIVADKIRKLDEKYGGGLDTIWSLNELYDNANFVKSALEIPIRDTPFVTYVWFATDEKQSPLMCTEFFKSKIVKF